jgi:RNA polymerase sigma factor (sigma-70 family)
MADGALTSLADFGVPRSESSDHPTVGCHDSTPRSPVLSRALSACFAPARWCGRVDSPVGRMSVVTREPTQASGGEAARDAQASGELTVWFLGYRDRGDVASLDRVVSACGPVLRRVAERWAPAREAEDLTQEVFIAALQNASSFDGTRPLLPWLLGILHNLARARRRAVRRLPTSATEDPDQRGTPASQDPVAILVCKEWLARVAAAIARLPDPYRSVVLRAVLGGDTPTTIAADLQRSPSTVRTQLERGLRDLRLKL